MCIRDRNRDYTFTSEFDKEVNEILAELKKNNPQIPQNLKVLIAKDNMPNAFCLPDGTFIINMGLFNWMENKDQVAGVICHEIAHNVLEHSLKTVSYTHLDVYKRQIMELQRYSLLHLRPVSYTHLDVYKRQVQ